MTIQDELKAILNALAAGGAHAGSAPTNPTSPYITYFRVTSAPNNVLSGAPNKANTRLQIDVWAKAYGDAQTLAVAVKTAIATWQRKSMILLEQDLFEEGTLLHRVSIDVSVWH